MYVRAKLNERLFEKIQGIELKRMKADKEKAKYNKLTGAAKLKADQDRQREELMNIGKNAGKRNVSYVTGCKGCSIKVNFISV